MSNGFHCAEKVLGISPPLRYRAKYLLKAQKHHQCVHWLVASNHFVSQSTVFSLNETKATEVRKDSFDSAVKSDRVKIRSSNSRFEESRQRRHKSELNIFSRQSNLHYTPIRGKTLSKNHSTNRFPGGFLHEREKGRCSLSRKFRSLECRARNNRIGARERKKLEK